jgi:hypothetical protein
MLPLGSLEMGGRRTRFTADEQVPLLTLWSIARSPLIVGGDLRNLDDSTGSLLTNDEVLQVNQASRGNREIFRSNGLAAWSALAMPGQDRYLDLFNLRDSTPAAADAPVCVRLEDLGMSGSAMVRDLWLRSDGGVVGDEFALPVTCHGARLLRLSTA